MLKRKVTACLLAGVLVLAVSAGAAFESVNGYAAYKNGVKTLLLKTNNVTLTGELAISIDGKEMATTKAEMEIDGANLGTHNYSTTPGEETYEHHDVYLNGVNTWYSSHNAAEKSYYSNTYEAADRGNLMGFDADDEMQNRVVTFMELAADSVVGDLKNNFVSLGKEDGLSKYQVNISKQQVPAVVNAGLSLIAYSQFSENGYNLCYEDYEATFLAYYEKKTGAPVPQELLDNYYNGYDEEWVEANQDLIDAFEDTHGDFSDQYYDILDDNNGGIVYVKKDGTSRYYATQAEFYQATQDGEAPGQEYSDDYWGGLIGKDLTLEGVDCSFALDDKGRLVENGLKATFATTDLAGKPHAITIDVVLTAESYGTTQVTPLDVTGWTNLSASEED